MMYDMKDRFFCRKNSVCMEVCSACESNGVCDICASFGEPDVCVRLQAITEEDARAEGAEKMYPYTDPETGKTAFLLHENGTYRAGFSQIWDSTIPKRPSMFERYLYYWEYNPWVWVIEFERIKKELAK